MRYVVIGAGAVGATIGARLHQAGHEVVLVARGAHAEVMRADGLRFASPEEDLRLRIPVVTAPDELTLRADDALLLSVKTQDTVEAATQWAAAPVEGGGTAGERLPLVCAQNGVESERICLRYFAAVYGMCVWLPATYIEPAVVTAGGSPNTGVLTLGRYPSGRGEVIAMIAADLTAARFVASVVPDVMRWKHLKLITNLANAIEALVGTKGDDPAADALRRRAVDEGRSVLQAADIAFVGGAEEQVMRAHLTMHPVPGHSRGGGSSWQSLTRGTGSIETDYLNGEIVRLGRTVGVPTPVNALLQRAATQAARTGLPPGSVTAAGLLAMLG